MGRLYGQHTRAVHQEEGGREGGKEGGEGREEVEKEGCQICRRREDGRARRDLCCMPKVGVYIYMHSPVSLAVF